MGWAFWAVVCLLAAMTALVVTLGVLLARERRRGRAERAALLAEQRQLVARLEELSQAATEHADWVITRLGDNEDDAVVARPVSDQLVLSAAFGEPLVKVLAFGHGVRRALAAESRNRIRFEMRREVRRARKTRRKEMKSAWRQMRTERGQVRGDGHVDGQVDGQVNGA
jgi:hypothetical protein